MQFQLSEYYKLKCLEAYTLVRGNVDEYPRPRGDYGDMNRWQNQVSFKGDSLNSVPAWLTSCGKKPNL